MYHPVFHGSRVLFDFPSENSSVKLLQFLRVCGWDFKVDYGVVHSAVSPPLLLVFAERKE